MLFSVLFISSLFLQGGLAANHALPATFLTEFQQDFVSHIPFVLARNFDMWHGQLGIHKSTEMLLVSASFGHTPLAI
jgi:hypothetical protein